MRDAWHAAVRTGAGETAGKFIPGSPASLIRISPIVPAPALLRQMGHDPDGIARSAGLDPHAFDDPETIVSYACVGRYLALCASATGCPHIGLVIGGRRGLAALGTVGMLVREGPDVRCGLEDLVRYLRLHDEGAVPALDLETDHATLSYAICAPGLAGAEVIADIAAVLGLNIMRELCGTSFTPTEVLLPRPKPADPAPYRRFFQAPVRFGAERTALSFESRWLSERIARADPDLRRLLTRQLAQVEATSEAGFADRVARVIRTLVIEGDCSAEHVAGLMGVHKRTLGRRLGAEGTTLRKVVEESRRQVAQKMLRDGSAPLSQVATALGYSEGSAFTRAFRRWTGASPAQWRSNGKGEPSSAR